jgi:hypothetical protein
MPTGPSSPTASATPCRPMRPSTASTFSTAAWIGWPRWCARWPGLRQSSFHAHVLVEMLLDRWLMERDPVPLHHYYQAFQPEVVAFVAEHGVSEPGQRAGLRAALERFATSQFLRTYRTSEGLANRFLASPAAALAVGMARIRGGRAWRRHRAVARALRSGLGRARRSGARDSEPLKNGSFPFGLLAPALLTGIEARGRAEPRPDPFSLAVGTSQIVLPLSRAFDACPGGTTP